MSHLGPFDVHVVSHTHWDREWYLPLARLRQQLVALIDELVDEPSTRSSFLLDGQAVLLEDYLAARPDRGAELRAMLASGAIEAGPWFVLADELLVSGEALVRNLFAGIRTVRAHGGAEPRVLYCPDSFGHPADLPTLAAGFGFSLIILWRGLGGPAWPEGDAFLWRAPSGARVLVHHLPPAGYEYGANLPQKAAPERWSALRAQLARRARTSALLVLNGADHHARQAGLAAAIDALARLAHPDRVRTSTLGEFAAAFSERAKSVSNLPQIEGELRFSPGYTWTVPGTWSSRTYQKRRNAHVERLLTREAEPWSAIATARGARPRGPLIRSAWRTLLECHPHDTLCGCSTDDVARAADARCEFARTEARGVVADAVRDLVRHDAAVARVQLDAWRPQVLVRNAAARGRSGVAWIEIERFVAPEPVGPGSAGHVAADRPLDAPVLEAGRVPLQVMARRVVSRRVESPRHYPRNDRVEVARCLAWVDDVPGYGIVGLAVENEASREVSAPAIPVPPVRATASSLDNGHVRLTCDARGTIGLESMTHARTWSPLIRFEDVGDAGDLYTHSSIGEPITAVRCMGSRLGHAGPLRGELEARFELGLPASSSRQGRSQKLVRHHVDVTLGLDAGATFLRASVRGVNRSRDHRLRIVFHTGVTEGTTSADAMFGPVTRAPRAQPNDTRAMELIPPTAPLARWVSRRGTERGMTIISDGLGEYEALADGGIAITLVRSVGALSRNDLPERPGHAGWPVPTPGAQLPGPYRAAFALLPHGPASDDATIEIERAADDALLPLVGTTLRSALSAIEPVAGLSLMGDGLRFLACKESEDGAWTVLRCVNVTSRPVTGSWRCSWQVREARRARLDEQPGEPLAVRDGSISVTLGASEVATVLVR